MGKMDELESDGILWEYRLDDAGGLHEAEIVEMKGTWIDSGLILTPSEMDSWREEGKAAVYSHHENAAQSAWEDF